MTAAPPLLEVVRLGVSFPLADGRTLRAVHEVSFTLQAGASLALIGESGSGKSTIARLITRLIPPSAGEVRLHGVNVLAAERRPSRSYRALVQMIFQDPFGSTNPVHTVRHHIERPLLIHGRSAPGACEALLERVGLTPAAEFAARYPAELSGGQLQRVAIARALAANPRIIIADEPTSMLDVSARVDILRLLKDLQAQGTAILFITHDLAAARLLADHLLVLYAGQLMEMGATEAVLRDPQHPYTRLLLAAAPRAGGSVHGALPARSGLPPTINPPPGCPFVERCLQALPVCTTPAPLRPAPRQVRCHLSAPGDPHPHEPL